MKKTVLFLLLFPSIVLSQSTTIIKGIIKNKKQQPIENVSIKYKNSGTTTGKDIGIGSVIKVWGSD